MQMSLKTEVRLFGVMKSVVLQTVSICAWCPDGKEKTEAAQRRGHLVSHGMCPSCHTKMEMGK